MSKKEKNTNEKIVKSNKYLVGPGLGLVIMGVSYILWWIGPWAWEAYANDPRWAHNWAYAIILLTVGLAWYHKSAISRAIAVIQAFMLPVTASGSFNALVMTYVTTIIAIIWVVVVIVEKAKGKLLFEDKMKKRSWIWINMHSMVVAWILIAHMSLVFLIGRLPLEQQLLGFGTYAGYLANLPPESLEFATWAFDITLLIWAAVVLWEQFKMGYNVQNKPWPKYSFYMAIVCMGSSLLALLIQDLTIGF
jgi:hypothetical protein